MNGPWSLGPLAAGVYLGFVLIALYAAWRLVVAVRRRHGWREIVGRVLHLVAIGLLLYVVGARMSLGQTAPPSTARSRMDYMEFAALGLLLLGQIVHGSKPRGPDRS